MMKKALFLDRDGVINREKNYVFRIRDFEFMEGIFEVLQHFQSLGYLLIVITNQAGIGRGYYSESDFCLINNWMLRQFKIHKIYISKVYYCPYHPTFGLGKYKKDAFCRKPNPGMILEAKNEFNIDLSKSILIGDKISDIEAGINSGIKTNVLIQNSETILTQSIKATILIESLKDLLHDRYW